MEKFEKLKFQKQADLIPFHAKTGRICATPSYSTVNFCVSGVVYQTQSFMYNFNLFYGVSTTQ
jgi:hypothetical protein